MSFYFIPDQPNALTKAAVTRWLEIIGGYPAPVLAVVLDEWEEDMTRRPSPAEIKQRCEEKIGRAMPVEMGREEEPKPVLSMERRRELAAELGLRIYDGGKITVARCVEAVSRVTGIGAGVLRGGSRTADVCRARFMAMRLAKEVEGHSHAAIARALDRDHTTIHHGLIKADELEIDPKWSAQYEAALAALTEG